MIRFFIGLPGSGKTTLACKLLKQKQKKKKRYKHFYSNFPTTFQNVSLQDVSGLGKWTYKRNSFVSIDEAGIDYNNRKFKEFAQYTIKWFKRHRHRKIDLDFFSQESDIDQTIKRLVEELYTLRRIGPWTLSCRWSRKLKPDDDGGWPKIVWEPPKGISAVSSFLNYITFGLFPSAKNYQLTFRPFYYKYFDSYEDDDLPEV